MSGHCLALLVLFLSSMLCGMQSSFARSSDDPKQTTLPEDDLDVHALDDSPGPPMKVLLLLGLRAEVNELVKIAISEELASLDVQHVELPVAASSDFSWPTGRVILATGRQGCQVALNAAQAARILCTLLTEEGFSSLDKRKQKPGQLSALVIDQPVSRQAKAAHLVYPSLTRFAVLSATGASKGDVKNAGPVIVDAFKFDSSLALPPQLSDVLSSHDALIATSDSSIFNTTTLSPVLLTAYGYQKPVIGFSRAYVKAGALITCYSTTAQILREVPQILHSDLSNDNDAHPIRYPRYFSVVDNVNVARSLSLLRGQSFVAGQTLTDADLEP